MSTPPPIPQPLRDDLVEVVRVGIEAAGDLHAPDLARVARELVPHAALGDAIKGALDKALETLGDTPYARSGRALIGQTPATKGAKLGARREAAAEEVPISPRQFRRPGSYESRVIEVIGNALLELTRSRRLVAPPGGGAALSKLGGQVQIVPATPSDHDFVVELMTAALSPYYGGDHRAHADRIFTTHISGGQDHLGFFSLEQRMFVATLGGDPRSPRLGMVHLVAKRQGTYKISPLIVAPEVRGRLHIGSRLLDFAEKHARSNEARELYCTVAEDNRPALQFFLRNGFVIAGRSDSHYKAGVTEVMLYKLLAPAEADRVFDTPNISVLPMETDMKTKSGRSCCGSSPGTSRASTTRGSIPSSKATSAVPNVMSTASSSSYS